MIVENIMNSKVITVHPDNSVAQAIDLMRDNNIRHLPVTTEGNLIGIISDRDMRSVSPSILTGDEPELLINTKVKDIMQKQVITVHPLDFLEEAARLIYEYKVGCLPVVSQERVVGIITEADVLRSMVEWVGLLQPGAHLELELPNRPGMLASVAGIVQRHGVNIISALLFPGKMDNTQTLILRLKALDIRMIIKDIEAEGHKVLWPLQREPDYER
ncbi:MAG: CBS and ACT domain-containing protein [Desulfitobacteriaceae bacterium]|nr:CBS and ACT domain-containing protein [Desulfitobacteriaceae bacterium]